MSSSAAELSPAARALLERRSAKGRGAGTGTIPRLPAGATAPISFAQWRLWFLEQLQPGTSAWNTPVITRIRGRLDLEALERSLQLLVDRHDTLRTIFRAPRGRPAPVALAEARIELPVAELSEEGPADGMQPPADGPDGPEARAGLDASALRWVASQIRRPFELESDLMLRAAVLRLAPEDHVLVLVAHHIACDGWSKGLLVSELGVAYEALCAGREPALAELTVEYADFAAWQRAVLSGETLDRLTTWWQTQLAGHPSATELPIDLPRPRSKQFEGAVQWLSVPDPLAQRLLAIGRTERATPFMTLLATFNALLHSLSGQEDLLVGSPSAMRTLPELAPIVGLFANTLVYRTSLECAPSFRALLGRVRDTALGVYQHQDLPFERIVEAVAPPRDPSRNPLVQVNMRVEGEEPVLVLGDLRCEPITVDPGIARFDLAIELGATGDGFEGYLEYDTHLFSAASAQAIAERYLRLLEAVAENPEVPLVDLSEVREFRA